MKSEGKRYCKNLLIILSAGILFFFSQGCRKEQEPDPEPFVRLLKNQIFQSKLLKNEINYAVLLPANYDSSDESYPVVYLLHGFGDNESAWYSGGRISYYSDKYAEEISDMIFVMPEAFNSYYVNRYNGRFPYMEMFTREFVPAIDSIFRTKRDKMQRAVMGYSMGGFGALILPAKNPEMFEISIPLSMSFRTDEQYISEPGESWDYQWGSVFGGAGKKGEDRLTEYFIQNSPFHFFKGGDLSGFENLKIFIDCGDDEESLSVTNSELHVLLREKGIPHEYRVRNGGHSWDYWHNSIHEALLFINTSFQGGVYPEGPVETETGDNVPSGNIHILEMERMVKNPEVLVPPDYMAESGNYPVVYFVHDFELGNRADQNTKFFSLLYNAMLSGKLTKSLVVEIPFESSVFDQYMIGDIINKADENFATIKDKKGRMILGNRKSGNLVSSVVSDDTSGFTSCILLNAIIDTTVQVSKADVFYYLDGSDSGIAYKSYHKLFLELRNAGKEYEYRIRQGEDSFESFLNGLTESIPVLQKRLKIKI